MTQKTTFVTTNMLNLLKAKLLRNLAPVRNLNITHVSRNPHFLAEYLMLSLKEDLMSCE